MIYHIQLLLEENPTWILLKKDVKNTFNSIKRSHLLEKMSHNFPDSFSHVTQMYSSLSPLVYLQGDHTVVLSSEEGVHQGDPLVPVLFSAGIQLLLSKLQEKYPAITLLAYLDDVFAVGEPTSVFSFLEEIVVQVDCFTSSRTQVSKFSPHFCFI